MLVLYNETNLWSNFIRNVQPLNHFVFRGLKMRSNYHSIGKRFLRKLVGNYFGLKIDFVNSNIRWIKDERILLLGIYPLYDLINIYRVLGNRDYVLWLWNPVERTYVKNPQKTISHIKSMGFQIFTFDEEDSIKYGLHLLNQFVSLPKVLPKCEISTDIYFVGFPKGREEKLTMLDMNFKKNGFKTDIRIIKDKRDYVSYEDNIRLSLSSKCILELTQENQSGMTLRCLEALLLKKKLLTDNADIVKADFYNPYNIFILGRDDDNYLIEFVNSPFKEVNNKITEKYLFSSWLKTIFQYV